MTHHRHRSIKNVHIKREAGMAWAVCLARCWRSILPDVRTGVLHQAWPPRSHSRGALPWPYRSADAATCAREAPPHVGVLFVPVASSCGLGVVAGTAG